MRFRSAFSVAAAATLLAATAGAQRQADPTPDNPRRIILDIDPGIDDAMALLLAAQSPELQIEAVTVVAGNVTVDVGTRNALQLVELSGHVKLPVARGGGRPLQRKLITAEIVHGPNGLGGLELPPPTRTVDSRHAVDLILELVNASPGEITLLPVGPLTNIAVALLKDPTLSRKVPEIILMGGSIAGGNATAAAEANIYNDPEAARVVFESGIPITMVDLGATGQTLLERRHLPRLQGSDSPIGRAIGAMADFYIGFAESIGFEGASLHDPLAVGIAIDRTLATDMRPMRIDVETRGEFTYGETVANRFLLREALEDAGDHYVIGSIERVEPNAEVPVTVDAERFVEMFLARLSAPPRSPHTPER